MNRVLIGVVALASLASLATAAHAETFPQLRPGGLARPRVGRPGPRPPRRLAAAAWRRDEEWRPWHRRCHLERFVRYDFYGMPVVETYRVCR